MNEIRKPFQRIGSIKNDPRALRQEANPLTISPSQVQNPIWKTLKINYKVVDEQIADFIVHETKTSILFLSLKFYYAFPLYLQDKTSKFLESDDARSHPNKILLLLYDSEDYNDFLFEINMLCLEKGIKLLVGFTFKEIANYLSSLKYISANPGIYLRDTEPKKPKDAGGAKDKNTEKRPFKPFPSK